MTAVRIQVSRWARLLLLVWAGGFGAGCASTPDESAQEIIKSGRTGVIIAFVRPRGLQAGSGYRSGTTSEEWEIRGKEGGRAVLLRIRIGDPRVAVAWPAGASDDAVANYWRDTFANPTSQTIGTFELAGQRLPLRHIRNIDGDILAIDPFMFDGHRVLISFRFEQSGDAESWHGRFSEFVRSLVVRRRAGVVIWKPSSKASSAVS